MIITSYIVWAYSAFLIFGGLMAWVKAHSLFSLAVSAVSGIILGILGWGIRKNCMQSLYLAAFVTAILFSVFVYRSILTMKVVPYVIAGISFAVLVFLIYKICQGKSKKV